LEPKITSSLQKIATFVDKKWPAHRQGENTPSNSSRRKVTYYYLFGSFGFVDLASAAAQSQRAGQRTKIRNPPTELQLR
jgi:hypothetical protein